MADKKVKSVFVCSQCGYETPKWAGKCPGCESWNTFEEEIREKKDAGIKEKTFKAAVLHPLDELITDSEIRNPSGLDELDRVLGGGIVKGSLILVGGDPGIGKSTLLLQMCGTVKKDVKVLYVTGEESARQIKLRAARLGVKTDNVFVLAETDIEVILDTIEINKPDIVIVDSIQTMTYGELNSSAGSISQVRECTNLLMRSAKNNSITVFLIGHVNKEGAIAGPKVLEHTVDVVLYFESDNQMQFRILRSVKNRYGSTNEIGVFEMTDKGLSEIKNPSLAFLSGRPVNVSGTCVVCIMEGSRPILSEIQALVSKTPFSAPRRTTAGIDFNRLCLLLAVLEKRAGMLFFNFDVYVNVIGGLKLDETAVDLGVCMALASGFYDFVVSEDVLVLGEVGLAGEVRAVSNIDSRLKEAKRLGFTKCIVPFQNKISTDAGGLEIIKVKSVREAILKLK